MDLIKNFASYTTVVMTLTIFFWGISFVAVFYKEMEIKWQEKSDEQEKQRMNEIRQWLPRVGPNHPSKSLGGVGSWVTPNTELSDLSRFLTFYQSLTPLQLQSMSNAEICQSFVAQNEKSNATVQHP